MSENQEERKNIYKWTEEYGHDHIQILDEFDFSKDTSGIALQPPLGKITEKEFRSILFFLLNVLGHKASSSFTPIWGWGEIAKTMGVGESYATEMAKSYGMPIAKIGNSVFTTKEKLRVWTDYFINKKIGWRYVKEIENFEKHKSRIEEIENLIDIFKQIGFDRNDIVFEVLKTKRDELILATPREKHRKDKFTRKYKISRDYIFEWQDKRRKEQEEIELYGKKPKRKYQKGRIRKRVDDELREKRRKKAKEAREKRKEKLENSRKSN